MTSPLERNSVTDPHRPPVEFDAELQAAMADAGLERVAVGVRPEDIPEQRAALDAQTPTREDMARDARFRFSEPLIQRENGPDVPLLVAIPRGGAHSRGTLYITHGGGLIAGSARYALGRALDMADALGMTVVSVEYRLAPEHPYPAAHDDAWAGFRWAAEHANVLHSDAERIVLYGGSAGANLAASLALRARDTGDLSPLGQMLLYPMLDDRNDSVSAAQMRGRGVWDQDSNRTAWSAVLAATSNPPSAYAAPARARDLSALAPAYLEVGSAETFRDETVTFASRIWQAGGNAELHVWPGAFHGFDVLAPHAQLSRQAGRNRLDWLRRQLGDD